MVVDFFLAENNHAFKIEDMHECKNKIYKICQTFRPYFIQNGAREAVASIENIAGLNFSSIKLHQLE